MKIQEKIKQLYNDQETEGRAEINKRQSVSDDLAVIDVNNLPLVAVRRGEETEAMVDKALKRHTGLKLYSLFRSEEKNLVQVEVVNDLAQGFEHRRKSVGMALEARLHAIREACNHVLVTGKTHLRQQRIEYFAEILGDVEHRMTELSDEFLSNADARFSQLEKFQSKLIREREEQRLVKSVDTFLNTLDRLMSEFTNIIREHIGHDDNLESVCADEPL